MALDESVVLIARSFEVVELNLSILSISLPALHHIGGLCGNFCSVPLLLECPPQMSGYTITILQELHHFNFQVLAFDIKFSLLLLHLLFLLLIFKHKSFLPPSHDINHRFFRILNYSLLLQASSFHPPDPNVQTLFSHGNLHF